VTFSTQVFEAAVRWDTEDAGVRTVMIELWVGAPLRRYADRVVEPFAATRTAP
jgi:hypothetical protein